MKEWGKRQGRPEESRLTFSVIRLTLQPPRLLVLVKRWGGVENPGRGRGQAGGRGCKGKKEVKEASFAPGFGECVVILSEWGGGEDE